MTIRGLGVSGIGAPQGGGLVSQETSHHTTFERSEFDITDLGVADATLREMFGTGSAELGPGEEGFRWRGRSYVLGGVRINAATLARNLLVRSDWMADYYVFTVVRGGLVDARYESERVCVAPNRHAMMLSPERSLRLRFSNYTATQTLAVPRADLDDHFVKLTQSTLDGPLRFDLGLDVSRGQGAGLARLVAFTLAECERADGLASSPLLRSSLRDALLTAVIATVPHARPAQAQPPARSIAPGHLRRAEAWIDAHASEPVGVAEISAAAGVSARTLQDAFRRHRGVTPLQFLRARRLEMAHRKLLEAEPGATVASVAHAVGFGHFGRFAIEYRERFHESPSDTLRRRGHI